MKILTSLVQIDKIKGLLGIYVDNPQKIVCKYFNNKICTQKSSRQNKIHLQIKLSRWLKFSATICIQCIISNIKLSSK